MINPIDGIVTSVISYTATDNAGVLSPIGTVTLPFSSSLPVTLIWFKASKSEMTSALTWSTSEETNSDHFEIQHSNDATKWTVASKVAASGESKAVKNYAFTHGVSVSGVNYYRLKMIDNHHYLHLALISPNCLVILLADVGLFHLHQLSLP